MIWRNISTLNTDSSVRYYAKEEIKENFQNHKGFWKQSVVCKIAAHGYYDMRSAWKIFNRLFDDHIDSFLTKGQFMEAYNVREIFNAYLTPASEYYGTGHFNGD